MHCMHTQEEVLKGCMHGNMYYLTFKSVCVRGWLARERGGVGLGRSLMMHDDDRLKQSNVVTAWSWLHPGMSTVNIPTTNAVNLII
jgi:hypothetical protein